MDVTKAKAQPVQQVQAPKRSEQVQQRDAQVQAKRVETQRAAENKPRPTVNGQGHTIGTRLSVTA